MAPLRKRHRSTLATVVMLVVFFVLGSGMLVRGTQDLATSLKTLAWPATTGAVTEVDIRSERSVGSSGTAYYPVVQYQYTVNGQTYTGHRIWFTDHGSSPGWARAVIRDYAPGTPVPVYYDPLDPANAILKPGVSVAAILMLALGTLVALAGAGGLWLTLRKQRDTLPTSSPAPDRTQGIPLRFAVVFSTLWCLLALPAAWEAWHGHVAAWLLAAPLIGPAIAFGARALARHQTIRLAESSRHTGRLLRGRQSVPGAGARQQRLAPDRARQMINSVTVILTGGVLIPLYIAWRDLSSTGTPFLVFLIWIMLTILYLDVARRRLLALWDPERHPPRPATTRSRSRVSYGGLWLVIPVLLYTAASWTWKWMVTVQMTSVPDYPPVSLMEARPPCPDQPAQTAASKTPAPSSETPVRPECPKPHPGTPDHRRTLLTEQGTPDRIRMNRHDPRR